MSQPLDRTQQCEARGAIDHAAGEFWVESPFQMPRLGHNLSAYESNCLFLNVDGQNFIDASFASHADIDSDSRAVVTGDLNADGAPDLLVASVGGGPLRLFFNRIPTAGRSVRVVLEGQDSNRLGIGTRLVARCGEQVITRDLFPANGFMGQNPTELLLGVGDAATIDELTVRWPTGRTQSFRDIPVETRLRIVEGESEITR